MPEGDLRLFDELTREASREAAAAAILVWPVGSTEQHGPHLPTATDAMHAEWVALAAARRVSDDVPIVVAPTLRLGSSAHHLPFGGTISLSTDTYYRVLLEAVESWVAGGWRRMFIVNGHGGNHEIIQLVARDAALRHDVHIAAGSWWAIAREELIAAGAADAGGFPGHAGRFETSLVLAMRPDLVVGPLPHRDLASMSGPSVAGIDLRVERHGWWQAIDGYLDSPDLADAELGRRWLEVATAAVAEAYRRFDADTREVVRGADRGSRS
jgi:creatinine amidohydrolase